MPFSEELTPDQQVADALLAPLAAEAASGLAEIAADLDRFLLLTSTASLNCVVQAKFLAVINQFKGQPLSHPAN